MRKMILVLIILSNIGYSWSPFNKTGVSSEVVTDRLYNNGRLYYNNSIYTARDIKSVEKTSDGQVTVVFNTDAYIDCIAVTDKTDFSNDNGTCLITEDLKFKEYKENLLIDLKSTLAIKHSYIESKYGRVTEDKIDRILVDLDRTLIFSDTRGVTHVCKEVLFYPTKEQYMKNYAAGDIYLDKCIVSYDWNAIARESYLEYLKSIAKPKEFLKGCELKLDKEYEEYLNDTHRDQSYTMLREDFGRCEVADKGLRIIRGDTSFNDGMIHFKSEKVCDITFSLKAALKYSVNNVCTWWNYNVTPVKPK